MAEESKKTMADVLKKGETVAAVRGMRMTMNKAGEKLVEIKLQRMNADTADTVLDFLDRHIGFAEEGDQK